MITGVTIALLVCTLSPGKEPQCSTDRSFGPNKTIEDCLLTALKTIPSFPTAEGQHLGGVFCKSEVREDAEGK